ncbi:NAD-dependent epimerase/dehydratase family protein [Ornithinimicrobium sufpigmenti]|uniref:NAD-dependent epimerase/dehydratase family protein n=1 Tax=Ornithinimicrobium sufpigmenti TaxID=2508882 RepID=UPI001035D8CC|nr:MULTISPECIES: NAD-dependent epimerase/dehydratase family protein [unclassified Ornithinimicrobium]
MNTAEHLNLEGARTVVTGGAGFVGSHLCDALLARGASVICVDNLAGTDGSTRNIDHLVGKPQFEFVREDMADWAVTADLTGVDVLFNQAASKFTVSQADPARDLHVNALGTLNLLLAAHRFGVRKFVHASTGSVFGQLQATQDEDHPKNPASFYGVSKLAGESYCRVVGEIYDVDFSVLRYYHVIGTRQNDSDTGGVVPIFVRRALSGETLNIYGSGEQVRSFTSVHDVVRANLLAATDPAWAKQYVNCASSIQVSISELANFVRGETGSSSEIEHHDWRAGDIIDFDIDNSKILSLGMTFNKDWKAHVRDVIESHRSRNSERS